MNNDHLDKQLILLKNPWLSDVKIVSESISTQKDAKRDGQKNCLYLTEQQLGTYGRFGRDYFAADSGGIYMSLLLKPNASLKKLPEYTLLAASAVVSAIEKLTDKKPQIKWVNDLYLGHKKFVGILAESTITPEQTTEIIIGIGINFSISEFPVSLREKATSLFFDEVPTLTRSELIAAIWSEFDRLVKSDFFSIYKSHSFILGKQVTFAQNNVNYEGLAFDLTQQGELLVKLKDGSVKTLSSGEISLKKWT